MAETAKLTVKAEPTMWNKEMLIGTLFVPIIGTIIGGMIGKSRMKHEAEAGRDTTSEPSAWNKDTLLGGLLGGIVGRMIALVGAGAAETALPGMGGSLAMLAGTLIGSTIGAGVGANLGKQRLMREHEEAKNQQEVNGISQAMGKERVQEVQQGRGKQFAPVLDASRAAQEGVSQMRDR